MIFYFINIKDVNKISHYRYKVTCSICKCKGNFYYIITFMIYKKIIYF